MADSFLKITDRAKGCYWTVNPINPMLLGRRKNRLAPAGAMKLTANADILVRRIMIVDCDAGQPPDTCSTDAEKADSFKLAMQVKEFLSDSWPSPVVIDSGNGTTLLYRIDLPADDGFLIKRCLNALANQFAIGKAHIDLSVHNASKIYRFPGTMNRKGTSTPERPHRRSTFLEKPGDLISFVRVEQLEQLAALGGKVLKAKVDLPRHRSAAKAQASSQRADEAIQAGGRNSALASKAGSMRRVGLNEEEMLGALLLYNQRVCSPPLADEEVAKIAKSIARYNPGESDTWDGWVLPPEPQELPMPNGTQDAPSVSNTPEPKPQVLPTSDDKQEDTSAAALPEQSQGALSLAWVKQCKPLQPLGIQTIEHFSGPKGHFVIPSKLGDIDLGTAGDVLSFAKARSKHCRLHPVDPQAEGPEAVAKRSQAANHSGGDRNRHPFFRTNRDPYSGSASAASRFEPNAMEVNLRASRVNLADPAQVRELLESFSQGSNERLFSCFTTDGRFMIRPDSLIGHVRMNLMLIVDPNEMRRRLKQIGFVSEKLTARDKNGTVRNRYFWIGPEALLDEGQ